MTRSRVRRLLRRWTLPAILLAAMLVGLARPWDGGAVALANGVPTIVELSYLDGLSTWGPEDATGELEISFAEGYARLRTSGLPARLGRAYQGWIVNSESYDAISIGRFNADADDEVAFEGALPAITEFGFDLFIITVEPEPDDAPQPTGDRSIGGRFSLIGPDPNDRTSAADVTSAADGTSGAGATQQSPQQPGELPATGDFTLLTDVARVSLLLAAMALSLFVGLRLGQKRT